VKDTNLSTYCLACENLGSTVLRLLCEEYGKKLLASPVSDDNPDSSLVTNLTYT